MHRKPAGHNDGQIFARTAVRTKKINLPNYTPRGGKRL